MLLQVVGRRIGQRCRGKLLLFGLGLSGILAACGNNTPQLGPTDLARLQAASFVTSGSLVAGQVDGYLEFDVRRDRDQQNILQPLPIFIETRGPDPAQPALADNQGNTIFPQRAVVLLGNGQDQNRDGIPDPIPTTPPGPASPLLPYAPPAGWQSRATLAYVPNQTTIPGRSPSQRFGVYLASLLPFRSRLQFSARDTQDVFFPTSFSVAFTPAASVRTLTVSVANATASGDQPIVIAICNQLRAAAFVGLRNGSTTVINLPDFDPSAPLSPLDAPPSYLAEAYQFDARGSVQRISSNPASPDLSTVALVSATGEGGSASLTLAPSTDGNRLTCTGDPISNLRTLLPNFFRS